MKKNIITISREFGSGGHSIAQEVAKKLGVPCYDKALVEQVAKESGFNPEYIENQGEYASSFPFFRMSGSSASGAMNGMNADDYLWCIQRQTILNLAEKGPCIIVGRCADFILKERTDALHVFICADKAYRKERIVERYGETAQKPEQRLHQKDKQRRAYYRYYTDREWGAPQNYGLCLNSSVIGEESCVAIIAGLTK
ncbi:MAG: AAA family ATPase [Lawsonibacter sp.]